MKDNIFLNHFAQKQILSCHTAYNLLQYETFISWMILRKNK